MGDEIFLKVLEHPLVCTIKYSSSVKSLISPIIYVLFLTLTVEQVSIMIQVQGIVSWYTFIVKPTLTWNKIVTILPRPYPWRWSLLLLFEKLKAKSPISDFHNIGHWLYFRLNLEPTYDCICCNYDGVVIKLFHCIYHHYSHPELDHFRHHCCDDEHLLAFDRTNKPWFHINQI